MNKKIALPLVLLLLIPVFLNAQCAMCRAVLQNSGDAGIASGINDGITYLMVFPYLLVGGIAFFIWRLLRTGKQKS